MLYNNTMPTYTSEHLGVRLRVFFELSVVVISACAACILLSGCRTVLPASGKTEIVYWTGWSGHEFDVLQKLVDEYNNTHPDVHVRMLSVFGSYQKVRIAFAGGDTVRRAADQGLSAVDHLARNDAYPFSCTDVPTPPLD